MKNKWLVIILTVTLLLAATFTLQAQTISLFSSANITAVPTGLNMKLEIRGADQNRARLQNQFSNYIQQFKDNLINNSILTINNIAQSQTINSSYTKDTGYNNPQVYEKKLTFKITISDEDAVGIQNSTEKIIDLIEDNSPSNTRYNSLAELDLTYQNNYYYFAQVQKLQQKIFNNILQKNKAKSESLVDLLNSNSLKLIEIKEVQSASIANYKEEVTLSQPQLPSEVQLSAKFKFYYELN